MNIVDEIIKPYSINLTSENYDVLEDTGKYNKKEERIYKCHGHFSSVENALNKIAKLIVEVNKTYTIKEYIKELKEIKIKIEK